ncbi:hypothetical protein NDU88_004742 [Pleurodeles waltl]|uniref:Uncharacterized protein n=1 Tax=Pleurodeles waltl TaxID=8319 RepID=A0AAV7QGR4_PLEWA|nr:hypothetical protein NDU88_004742 [Pleurodeles waltl]
MVCTWALSSCARLWVALVDAELPTYVCLCPSQPQSERLFGARPGDSTHLVVWVPQPQAKSNILLPAPPPTPTCGRCAVEDKVRSGEERRKTTDGTKEEDVDDRRLPGMSSGSPGCAEPTAPPADCRLKENRRKPVVLFGDEGDRLRGARREDPPLFRRSMADAGQELVALGQDIPQTQVLIACVHRDQKYYQVAQIHLQWRGENETLKVGMLPHLEEDIIIGTDYADFPTLLTKAGQEHTLKSWWEEVPFEAGVGISRDPKVSLTRRQKRVQRQQYMQTYETQPSNGPAVASKVCTIAGDFRQSQQDDPSLRNAWQQAMNPEEQAASSKDSLPHTNPNLTNAYHEQLKQVVKKYSDVFSKRPGRTQLVKHPIRTKNEAISRQRPYHEPSRSSNHGVPWPSQRELRRLKGLPSLPEGIAIGSGEERRKTTDGTKEEDVDDRSLPGMSSGSPGCAEPTAPPADCRPKKNRRNPVVPFGDEGDRLRGARREDLPRLRRSVADTASEPRTEVGVRISAAGFGVALNQVERWQGIGSASTLHGFDPSEDLHDTQFEDGDVGNGEVRSVV